MLPRLLAQIFENSSALEIAPGPELDHDIGCNGASAKNEQSDANDHDCAEEGQSKFPLATPPLREMARALHQGHIEKSDGGSDVVRQSPGLDHGPEEEENSRR